MIDESFSNSSRDSLSSSADQLQQVDDDFLYDLVMGYSSMPPRVRDIESSSLERGLQLAFLYHDFVFDHFDAVSSFMKPAISS